jgi:dUTP pyrophosphatase
VFSVFEKQLRAHFVQSIHAAGLSLSLDTFPRSGEFNDPVTAYMYQGYALRAKEYGLQPAVTIRNHPQPILKVKKLHRDAQMPVYATPGAACFDISAVVDDPEGIHVRPGVAAIIDTGLAFEVPEGWVLKVYSRSGMGFGHGVRLANCVGIIDSDFRGELKIKLACDRDQIAENWSCNGFSVNTGKRIAQAMLVPAPQFPILEAVELAVTTRGSDGFGSTGA